MFPLARAQLFECRDVTRSILPGFFVEMTRTPTPVFVLGFGFFLFGLGN